MKDGIGVNPDSRGAHLALARVLAAKDNFREAEKRLREYLEANPEDLGMRGELGDLLAEAGDEVRAKLEYVEVQRLAPDDPFGYEKLAQLHAKQKN